MTDFIVIYFFVQAGGSDNLFLNYLSRIHREEVGMIVIIDDNINILLITIYKRKMYHNNALKRSCSL
jgi:hypothetical protein